MQNINQSLKEKFPLLFLVIISLSWAFYYQTENTLNNFGEANYEWLYLIDGLIILPLICLLCIKDKKQAAIKSLIYCCLVVLIGSYIIPESSKVLWPYLESGRYLIVAFFLLFEITAVMTVYLSINAALKRNIDPDKALSNPIEKYLGQGKLAQLFTFEARMWSFVFFAKRIHKQNYKGEQHFSYHLKDGAQSNLLGFIILILIELPIVHILLHFIWSPMAANIISILTGLSLIFFIAEYRAVSRRPLSVYQKSIYIRFGLFNLLKVDLNNVNSIELNKKYIKRSPLIKRYNLAGNPNLVIHLKKPINKIESIYLGLDQPEAFKQKVINEI